ncbi:type II toxin-antitoxin system RelE/ParE family toxin [Enterococcus sp. AZ128]|uniref:type II toxin-antitoxin system RelE/ParE family toxin n=1 Tax=unclassified Enterococcus TaxID=2608891 RepID=UPI003F683C41
MEKPQFDFVKRKDGSSEFEEFLNSIPEKDSAKLLATISKTEEHGLLVAQRMEWVKKLDTELFELRSKVGSNIQRAIYFQKIENEYLITHGFTKKQQKTPKSEIEHAKAVKERYERGEFQ